MIWRDSWRFDFCIFFKLTLFCFPIGQFWAVADGVSNSSKQCPFLSIHNVRLFFISRRIYFPPKIFWSLWANQSRESDISSCPINCQILDGNSNIGWLQFYQKRTVKEVWPRDRMDDSDHVPRPLSQHFIDKNYGDSVLPPGVRQSLQLFHCKNLLFELEFYFSIF